METENAADNSGHGFHFAAEGFGIEHPAGHAVKEHQNDNNCGKYDAPADHTAKSAFPIEFKYGHLSSPPS